MSADKYPSIFSRQMEAIVYLFIINPLLTRLLRLRLPIKLRNIYGFIKFYFSGSAECFFSKRTINLTFCIAFFYKVPLAL